MQKECVFATPHSWSTPIRLSNPCSGTQLLSFLVHLYLAAWNSNAKSILSHIYVAQFLAAYFMHHTLCH